MNKRRIGLALIISSAIIGIIAIGFDGLPEIAIMPLLAISGIIVISGKPSNPIAIIPIIADETIKAKPIRRLFNKLLNFL